MIYPSGERIQLGDVVLLEGRARGVVVGVIDDATYTAPYTAENWDYLKTGVLIEADDAGLMHYEVPDEAWVLISRA